jgi:iron complex outermembrane receptor protein
MVHASVLPPSSRACRRWWLAAPLIAWLVLSPPPARSEDADTVDYTRMNLEQLMDVEITSVSRRPQRVSAAAAAVFVITQEDIRTSGATSIPELLRMAPGVQVAQLDANKWAITIRGFNGRYANKLLVLQDGRNLYTPVYGGVFWDLQDTLLEDIERIEVIRGPGGTLWGANAVNGVINIITKNARDTQGALAYGAYGNAYRSGGGRYGGTIGDDLAWRGFAKFTDQDDSKLASGDDASDGWRQGRMGFRTDWTPRSGDKVSVSGEVFRSNANTDFLEYTLSPPFRQQLEDHGNAYGGYLLGNWQHEFTQDSRLSVTSYYDWYKISQRSVWNELGTYDIEVQHDIAFDFLTSQLFTWGLEYRRYDSLSKDSGDERLAIDPARRSINLFSAFLQNEITLIEDALRLTLGSKFEYSDFAGFGVQPNARLVWTPDARQSVWGAVSRGVRTPSIGERDANLLLGVLPPGDPRNPTPLPVAVVAGNGKDLGSEKVNAYELGYRVQPLDNLSLDVAAFYNDYDRLSSVGLGATSIIPGMPPVLVQDLKAGNAGSGETYGGEVATTWNPVSWLSLRGAYSYLRIDLDKQAMPVEGRSPLHQASLRALIDLGDDWDLDLWLRYVDELKQPRVHDYVTGDVRLAWRPMKGVELSIVGQNLFNDRQQQFAADYEEQLPGEVERSVYGKLELRF